MFPLLFRVLTIAGTCTIAAILTREIMRRRHERQAESELPSNRQSSLSLEDRSSKSSPGAETTPAEAPPLKERLEEAAQHASDLESQRKKRDDRKSAAKQARQQANELADKAKAAAQEALAASKSVQSSKQAKSVQEDDQDPSAVRARSVINSSRQILDTYKQPPNVSVDLSLAHFAIDTAQRLMAEKRYDEAWEKAGAVGMMVGMAEIRANVESQLKELQSDDRHSERIKGIRQILAEADVFLAEAGKSFVTDTAGEGPSPFMPQLQSAMAKTMKAMTEANGLKLNI